MAQGERTTIRVVVADDHPMLRTAVVMACEDNPRLEVVGEASNGPEALEKCRALNPDVLVLDLGLPGLDGFEVAAALRSEEDPPRILVLTARDDPRAVLESMRVEVHGFLDKSTGTEDISEAIEAVARGERIFTDAQQRSALSHLGDFVRRSRERSRISHRLTERELEVLQLIAQGMTTRQMATRLQMSPRTVESHINKLYRKLDVKTRVQAVGRAEELGLFQEQRAED